jgi:hypothetical protein
MQENTDECKALLREKLSVLLKAEKLHTVVTLQQAASVEQALKACTSSGLSSCRTASIPTRCLQALVISSSASASAYGCQQLNR